MARAKVTAASVRRTLLKALPTEIAEVLLPTIHWRVGKQSITAVVPNQVWEDLFKAWCLPPVSAMAEPDGLDVRVRCSAVDAEQVQGRRATFANFLQDPGNQFALTACRSVVEAPGLEHNPLYLSGASGVGKSHLLQALAADFTSLVGGELVVQLTARDWVGHQAQELAERGSSDLRQRLESAALITFDGVDDLAGRALAQEQLFHLINEGLDHGQQLVVAGRGGPRELTGIEDRLATRLSWGLAVSLDTPLTETRAALLRQLVGDALEEQEIGDLAELVDTLAPDMHQVVALGERLVRGERPTAAAGGASFDRIVAAVAKHYGLRPGDIAGKRRHRQVTTARQVALLLGRRLTDYSLEALGGMVGGRDHSTVLYSIRQAEGKANEDEDFARDVNRLTQAVLESGDT